MARQVKWTTKQASLQGNIYRADIYDNEDVTSDLHVFKAADVMVEYEVDSDDDITIPVRGMTGYLSVMLVGDEDKAAFDEMIATNPFDRKLIVTNETTGNVVFVGYLSTEAYSQELCDYIIKMQVPINSPLKLLDCKRTTVPNSATVLDFLKTLRSFHEYTKIYISQIEGLQATPQLDNMVMPYGVIAEKDENDDAVFVKKYCSNVMNDVLTAYGFYITENTDTLYILPYFGCCNFTLYTYSTNGNGFPAWSKSSVSKPEAKNMLTSFAFEGIDHKISIIKAAKSLSVSEKVITEGTNTITQGENSCYKQIAGNNAGGVLTADKDYTQAMLTTNKQTSLEFYKYNLSKTRIAEDQQIWPKHTTASGVEVNTCFGATSALNTKYAQTDNSQSWNRCILMCGGLGEGDKYREIATGLIPALVIKYPIPVVSANWMYIRGNVSESKDNMVCRDTASLTGSVFASIRFGDLYYKYSNSTTDIFESVSPAAIPVTALCGKNGKMIIGGHIFNDSTEHITKRQIGWKDGFWLNMPFSDGEAHELEITIYAPFGIKPENWLILENFEVGLRNNDDIYGLGYFKNKENKTVIDYNNQFADEKKIELNLYSELRTFEVITNYTKFHGYLKLAELIQSQFASKRTKIELNETRATDTNPLAVYTFKGNTYRHYSSGFNTSDERGKHMFIQQL